MGNPARFTGTRTTRAVFGGWTVMGALLAVAALLLSATPATAAPVSKPKPTTNPW
jgi:ABC-type xylose transport system permease subunit